MTDSTPTTPCPGEDTLLAFVGGMLTPAEGAALELHLDSCEACREVLAEAGRALADSIGADDLERPAPEALAPRRALPRPGERVGRYHIIDVLGRGAMGVVYAAYDPELDRRVAVKLLYNSIHLDAAGAELQARLVGEAQAMARLSHKNVVAVHDIGTIDGAIYIAMEIVEGTTLRAWLAASPRRWRDILAVFLEAGDGLAAAHGANIVHRDFKPDNVLVEHDGDAHPRRVMVTDFGLSRATPRAPDDDPDPDGTAADLRLTRTGAVLGTPAYMAPEQLTGGPLDARADVFAFGVSLYEALSGTRPYTGQTFTELAASLARGVPRELEATDVPRWVRREVMRAVAADPAARHPTMSTLLAALRRDPRKATLRVLVPIATLLALGATALGVWTLATRDARECRAGAERIADAWDAARRARVEGAFRASGAGWSADAFARTAATLDGIAERWAAERVDACDATHERGEQSDTLLDLRLACLDERRGELDALVSVLEAADESVASRGPRAAAGLPDVALCRDVDRLRARVPPPADPAVRARVAEAEAVRARAQASFLAGRLAAGGELAAEAQSLAEATGHPPTLASVLVTRARGAFKLGDQELARTLYDRAIPVGLAAGDDRVVAMAATGYGHLTAFLDRDAHAAERWFAIADAELARIGGDQNLRIELLGARGDLYALLKRPREAVAPLEEARAILEGFGDADPRRDDDPELAIMLDRLATTYQDLGELDQAYATFERAESVAQRALGPRHPTTLNIASNHANCLTIGGRYHESEQRLAQIVDAMRETLPADHWNLAIVRHMHALALGNLGRYEEAMALHQAALDVEEVIHRDNPGSLVFPLLAVFDTDLRAGHGDVALARIDRITPLVKQTMADTPWLIAACATQRGLALLELDRFAEAAAAFALAEPALRLGGATADYIATNMYGMGRALLALGRAEGAVVQHRGALAITEPMLGPDNVQHAAMLHALARALLETGQGDAAQAALERALRLVTARPYDPHVEAEVRLDLARVLASIDPGRSRTLVAQAESLIVGKSSPRARRIGQAIAAWRARRP